MRREQEANQLIDHPKKGKLNMGDTCTVGNEHEHVVLRQAVHVMVHVCSLARRRRRKLWTFQVVSSAVSTVCLAPSDPMPLFVKAF
eukprot:6361765-Prymnesium_polylepis.1